MAIHNALASQPGNALLKPTNDAYIDSGNSNSNYGGEAILAALNYNLLDLETRQIQSWLQFDISSIPPGATITGATLTLSLAYTVVNQNIGIYSELSNSWSQASITWNNAPRGSVGQSALAQDFVTNSTTLYTWGVLPALTSALGNGNSYLTLVLYPTSSEGSHNNGWSVFWSSEEGGSLAPNLLITYTYASSSVSLSSSSTQYGSSISMLGTTNPSQNAGTMTLQYSTDQVNWNTLSSGSGGTLSYNWQPPGIGVYYVRAVWVISWGIGQYTTDSQTQTFQVTPGPSSIQLSLSRSNTILGQPIVLTGTISPQASDGTVSIQYSLDQVTWVQLSSGTPSSGGFSYSWTPPNVETYYARATWSGDANYQATTSSVQKLTVTQIPTSLSLSALSPASLNQTTTVTAILRDNQNNPISGASVAFDIGSTVIGSSTTDTSGSATLVYKLDQSAGQYSVEASYGGSAIYLPTNSQTPLTVKPWILTVTSNAGDLPLVDFNGRNYTTDDSGTVMIAVNSTNNYEIHANSPLTVTDGVRVIFISWGDGLILTPRQISIDSNANISISTKMQYYFIVQSSYGKVTGTGWYDSGATARFTVNSIVDQGNGTRRVFTSWFENGRPFTTSENSSLEMTSPQSLLATWTKQFDLIVNSQYGNPFGQGWYDAGDSVTVSVQSPYQTTGGTRYVTTGYTGGGSAEKIGTGTNATFLLDAPSAIDFQWQPQYLVQTSSKFGSVNGTGWYDSGLTEAFSVQNPIISIQNGSRAVFSHWSGDGSSSSGSFEVVVNSPLNLTAEWTMQYYLSVSSQYSSATGQGWYDAGSKATVSMNQTSVPENLFISRMFKGWSGGTNASTQYATFTMNEPEQVVAVWTNDYMGLYLTIGGGAAAAIAIAAIAIILTFRNQKLGKV